MDANAIVDESILERLRDMGGDEFLGQMIDLFLEHTPKRLQAARTGLVEGDLMAVRKAVHSIKSSAGNLGAPHVYALAAKVEEGALQRDAELAGELFVHLEEAHRMACERLELAKNELSQRTGP